MRGLAMAKGLLALMAMTGAYGTPNIILFSVDDHIVPEAWQAANNDTIVASQAVNPNGCLPPITWFTSRGPTRGNCTSAQQAFASGHELATHTATHPTLTELSYDEIVDEIAQQFDWLVDECGIPAEVVTGFRAPYFRTNSNVTQALVDLGFEYDSSVNEQSPTQPPAYCADGGCIQGEVPIWEVPTYRAFGSFKRSDPEPANGMSVLERLQADFQRKQGSGAPVAIMVHEPYLSDSSKRADIVAFLQWALAQPDTWALTYQEYIVWLQAGAGDDIASVLAYTCTCSSETAA
ncbi:hypothetical protein D9Q98_001110 [Chlorella vulgaris]|uniref:NodB homology domain-containing protein n=1 Tax=Chlorella vulgaris TaxID=3077 RepID=A0A9D4U003_CHLVU|nr:hypothetical protein D9Q98_001110 [Chlorella vulgaris]